MMMSLGVYVLGAAESAEREAGDHRVFSQSRLVVGVPGDAVAARAIEVQQHAVERLAGQRFGLDPAVMLDVINTSTGRSFATLRNWPDYVLTGGYDSGFAMDLLVKDALIGLDLEHAAGTGSRLAEVTVEMWRRAANWLPAGADHTEIARWVQQTREGDADFAE